MIYQRILSRRKTLCVLLLIAPFTAYASFIESTIGTAVVNDATATYYNPAALTLLKNPQIISLNSVAYFHSNFTGTATQTITGFTQSGTTNESTHYYLPTLYVGIPTNNKVTVGIAVIANMFSHDIEDGSILRYVQPSNNVKDIDVVPAIGIKINNVFSLGAGITLSHAKYDISPITGLPSLTIPDSLSHNTSSGNSWGGDIGFLIKPAQATVIGFNYRSAITYQFSGTSTLESTPSISSNQYHFTFWIPARSVFTVSQFVNPKLGFLATAEYIQWNIIKNVNFSNIATQIGTVPVILPHVSALYHLQNGWLITIGSQYRMTPKWVIRVASSYVQSPTNPSYQISDGDNYVIGASTGYTFNKYVSLDGSYAHVFIKNENIHIANATNIINGVNKGFRDGVAVKFTVNM